MMTNLFSIFDPSTSILPLHLNWISMTIIFLLLPTPVWLVSSRANTTLTMVAMILFKEMKIIIKNKGMKITFSALFIFIMVNNSMGLLPYIFTATSHMLITLALSLPLWMGIILFGWIKNLNHMMTHMVPQGTPPFLMSFMVCIETISNVIRPGTLAVRLAANMIAGHLLLTILSEQSNKNPTSILPFLLLSQIALLTLEAAVAIIQAYVFTILSALYTSEVS